MTDSNSGPAEVQCPACDAPLKRLSLVCPTCRREIEKPIEIAIERILEGKKAKTIAPLTSEERRTSDIHERNLRRANVLSLVVLLLTWFLIYSLAF